MEAVEVKVLGVRIDAIEKAKQSIVVFIVKHPEKDNLEISKAKVLRPKDKLKVVGLWYTLDEDENIQKGSALADVMSAYGITSLKEATGKDLNTVADEDGYLCIKAYD